MTKRRVLAMLACGVLTAGLLTGCGGSSSDTAGADDAEITVVSREDGSGTRGAFVELFGVQDEDDKGEKTDMTTEDATITSSTEVVMTTVAGNKNAIGYCSLGSLNDTVKAVKIDGVEATVDNINNGKYAISRPFNIATNGTPSEVTQDFINYILSEDGQKIVEENGYIKASDAGAFKSNGAKGKIVVAGSSSVSPVMEKLIEAYKAVNKNAEIELQTTDSTTGMTSTIDGSYDIGMASRELKDDEAAELDNQVIATDGIAVIVNKNNTADELSSDQVKAIYTGEALTWDEVLN